MKKKIALLLALVMLLSLAVACGEKSEPSAPAEPSNSAEPTEPSEQPSDPNAVELPLVEETVDLSLWTMVQPYMMGHDFEAEYMFYPQLILEQTNINVVFNMISFLSIIEQMNIMFASGEYPDIISGVANYYPSGASGALDDGIIVDLMPHLDTYLPAYKAALDRNEEFWMFSLTNDGKLPSANYLLDPSEMSTGGSLINKTYLDEFGMEVPETYDELEAYLYACKAKLGNGGYLLGATGNDTQFDLSAGFGVGGYAIRSTSHPFQLADGGKIVYGPVQDGYREYLELCADWFKNGLIFADYASMEQELQLQTCVEGYGTVMPASYEYCDVVAERSEGAVNMVAMPFAVKNKGDVIHITKERTTIMNAWSVSCDCAADDAKFDAALKLLNFNYTEAGNIITDWGRLTDSYESVEGSYYIDENGEKKFTKLVLDNPNGYPIIGGIFAYTTYGGASISDGARYLYAQSETCLEVLDVWNSQPNDWAYVVPSGVALEGDAASEYGTIMGDIQTYVLEFTNYCIMGMLDINGEGVWEDYVAQLESMMLSRATELYQEAFDDYLGREAFIPA